MREHPADLERVLAFGYSQSGRFLREFVRDGFNADERGRIAFDGFFIASAGAGGGSFNHRFARPGDAGNSVLSILRPVDMPPFSDDGLLARARAADVTPKIFYTFSSTEYWARAGSLTHTSEDGAEDVPIGASSRLYFLAGTPHASGPLPLGRAPAYQHVLNFAEPRWVLRALLLDLDAWMSAGTEPPASRYPTIARKELVSREAVRFPTVPALPFPRYLPQVWPMDFGADFGATRIITREPPRLGSAYPVLVPQVDADGNDRAGIRLPEVAVPLGTHTGWNISVPPLPDLRYLSGLVGTFRPFARTEEERDRSGDERLVDRRALHRSARLPGPCGAGDDGSRCGSASFVPRMWLPCSRAPGRCGTPSSGAIGRLQRFSVACRRSPQPSGRASRVRDSLRYSGRGIPLAALLLPRTHAVFSVVSPSQPGAALRNICQRISDSGHSTTWEKRLSRGRPVHTRGGAHPHAPSRLSKPFFDLTPSRRSQSGWIEHLHATEDRRRVGSELYCEKPRAFWPISGS